jgi:hypothetical protein
MRRFVFNINVNRMYQYELRIKYESHSPKSLLNRRVAFKSRVWVLISTLISYYKFET